MNSVFSVVRGSVLIPYFLDDPPIKCYSVLMYTIGRAQDSAPQPTHRGRSGRKFGLGGGIYGIIAMLPEISAEELCDRLDAVAAEVLFEAGFDTPPVDAWAVAGALEITVAVDDRQRGRARYVRLRPFRGGEPKPSILLRPDPRAERRQWAVAHEIGEHVAWRVFELLGVDPREARPDARESVARELAGRLLLPAAWFEADAVASGWDLLGLKARYRTASHELIARRMLDFPPPVIVTVFDHGRVSLRRGNLPGRVPDPSARELHCWRTVHERNRPWQCTSAGQTVFGWPVHEDGWRREILRTEVDPWADHEPAADPDVDYAW